MIRVKSSAKIDGSHYHRHEEQKDDRVLDEGASTVSFQLADVLSSWISLFEFLARHAQIPRYPFPYSFGTRIVAVSVTLRDAGIPGYLNSELKVA